VATTLGKIGSDIIGPVTDLLEDPAQSVAVRAAAIRALGYTKSAAATELLKTAPAKQPEVRIAVVRAIGDIRDPAATDVLVAGLADSSEQVRDATWSVLKRWQLGEVTEQLRGVLDEEDEDARRRAAIVLAYHVSPEANRLLADVMGGGAQPEWASVVVEVLTETIEDKNEDFDLRRAAVKNLGAVATAASVDVLKEVLVPGSQFISEAAQSLALIGRRAAEVSDTTQMGGAAKQLLTLLKQTENEELRLEVAGALATMKDLPVGALLEGLHSYPEEVRPWAAGILAAIGEPATDPTMTLISPTRSKSEEQRLWCVAVLDAIGSKLATRFIKYLPDEEKDESLIEQVHEMKGRILQRM